MINKCSEYRNLQTFAQKLFFPARHLFQTGKADRIYHHDLIKQCLFIMTCHNYKGSGISIYNDIRLFTNYILYKVTDCLHINKVCISHSLFLGASASRKIQIIYGMFQCKFILNSGPFISGTTRKHIMNQKNRASFTFFGIINIAETPMIIISDISIQHFLKTGGCRDYFIYNMDSGSCCRYQCCKSKQSFTVLVHVLPPFLSPE